MGVYAPSVTAVWGDMLSVPWIRSPARSRRLLARVKPDTSMVSVLFAEVRRVTYYERSSSDSPQRKLSFSGLRNAENSEPGSRALVILSPDSPFGFASPGGLSNGW